MSKQTLAFAGVEHGVGTTCISLALANFLCSKMGKRTAYIELNTNNQISCLSSKRNLKKFSYMGIIFFPAVTVTSLPEILSLKFDYFILDIGVLNEYTAKEFVKCNKQFLVCSLCKWKQILSLEKIEELLKKNIIHQEYVTVLGNADMKSSVLTISSNIKCKFFTLPFIKNPFQLATTDFAIYHRLLG